MVQGWYQGGVSVFDFTDSTHPVEIAFFDRGPIDAKTLITGGFWSAYWYNGFVYASEIARGLDVFRLTPSEFLSQNEIDAASLVRPDEFNPQQQPKAVWPSNSVVARAYLDQLTRAKAVPADRAKAVQTTLERADELRAGREQNAGAVVDQLDALATALERDARAASGANASRLRALAGVLKTRAGQLKS